MATTLQQVETLAGYPVAPVGLSPAAAALDSAMIWERIEAYICHRYTARAVVWIVEGPGDWAAPLAPTTIDAVEVWAGEEWNTVSPSPSPMGGIILASEGPYRITATVGGGIVPGGVSEAFRRLAEYSAETEQMAGAASYSVNMGGSISESYARNPAWIARAMINSGAGDLLRPYRRAT